ncbi:MAG: hypothetical protein U5L11_14150 [Arhodomonas sp.]|nr:hypothetical protein [Arhodomonas sp.]
MIRSLVISQRLIGTREIGAHPPTAACSPSGGDDDVKAQIEAEHLHSPPFALDAFGEPEADVRQSLKRIAASPFIPHRDAVRGFVYDVNSGRLNEVQ